MRRVFVLVCLACFALQSVAYANNLVINPTTTLAQQTSNNTSAADSFKTQVNGNIAGGNVSKLDIHSLIYPGNHTKIYAHFMGWFGTFNHMNVGYDSTSRIQVARQVQDMVSRGIDGVIIDWYGQGTTSDLATLALMKEAETHPGFTFAIMVAMGVAIERTVLRPLTNKPPITLFMATLGLSYVIEGAAQLIWGTQVHGLELGIDDVPLEFGGVLVSQFDIFAAVIAAAMVALLSIFFRYTRIGLSFRAVADNQFAALAVGLRLPSIWATVWAAAGLIALVAGLLWGARLGVQFSLSLVVLKALPVLVLGGFDSILGAIVGGLVIGAAEKLAEVYIGDYFGGGIESWFAYVVALGFLLVRPSGLFGQKLVERV